MDNTGVLPGSLISASPSGDLVAGIVDGKLRVRAVQAPDLYNDIVVRSQSKEITALRWSAGSTRLLITSHTLIELIDLNDNASRMRISNGSGSLGRFQTADFISDSSILVTWEFGRTKIHSTSGKVSFTTDLKTQSGNRAWALLPRDGKMPSSLALLSQSNGQDHLNLLSPTTGQSLHASPLDMVDAQSLSWSPDGNWLAVLDAAYAQPGVVIFTQCGHRFREYPPANDRKDEIVGLHVKAITWSPDSSTLAVSRYDGSVVLLNTRTFSPRAIIEHSTTIDQPGLDATDRAVIWQEVVSATNARSYNSLAQPVSPPLSRVKASNEPAELGVAEARFSADGKYLATRDERMLSTVWIWDVASLAAHAVCIQHNNVRRMHWHSSVADLLLIDCAESIAYLVDLSTCDPPTAMQVDMPATPAFSFIPLIGRGEKPAILAATRSAFRLIFPQGRKLMTRPVLSGAQLYDAGESINATNGNGAAADEDDSLIEALTGRKSASYTKQVEVDADADGISVELDDTFGQRRAAHMSGGASRNEESDAFIELGNGEGLDDTFAGKSGGRKSDGATYNDPLDDSEIF